MNRKEETAAIWSEFSGQVRRHLLGKVRNESDADDLMQEVFVKIHRHAGELRDKDKLAPWIRRIVANTVADYYRKSGAPEVELDEEKTALDENGNDALACAVKCLGVFVSRLPDKYRDALLLADVEGERQKEAALRMGISYSGFKSRVQRGRAMIKDMFLGCCVDSLDADGNLNPRFSPRDDCPICSAEDESARN
ncbi:MAG: sigma-70 family RNA polymerase sigma factor [Candidatus Dadabacteria bacterium]|nr:sigma-70 family RNA polymerase sigma factor [Candidatus Dadabacteria bacterium]